MVPETVEYQLGQSIRDWMLASIPTLAADKILINMKGQLYDAQGDPTGNPIQAPRPELPYAVIRVLSSDTKIGYEDHWIEDDGIQHYRGPREATLEIQGYGLPTNDWLSHLSMRVGEAELGVQALGPTRDISALVEEDYVEARYLKEFTVVYAVENDFDVPADVAETAEVSRDFGSTITEDL